MFCEKGCEKQNVASRQALQPHIVGPFLVRDFWARQVSSIWQSVGGPYSRLPPADGWVLAIRLDLLRAGTAGARPAAPQGALRLPAYNTKYQVQG